MPSDEPENILTLKYEEVAEGKVFDLNCCNGIPENIRIDGVPANTDVIQGDFSTAFNGREVSFHISRSESHVEIHANSSADTLSQCMQLKDARLLLPLNTKDFLLRLQVKCSHEPPQYNRLMLALDLGNTRTCALLCPMDSDDDINQLMFEPLQMRPNYSQKASGHKVTDIFSSRCVLGINVHKDWTQSFIQLADNADTFLKSCPEDLKGRRLSLSGPKRYFWHQDILYYPAGREYLDGKNQPLYFLIPREKENYVLKKLDTSLARAMGFKTFHNNSDALAKASEYGFYPYSLFLKGMLWELMEQAELQANSPDFSVNKNTAVKRNFLLTDLVVTFPAVWTEYERQEYEKQIRETAELYVQQRCGKCAGHINVDVTCNEGMAVLTTFLYSQVGKNVHGEDKIAVVDIGGGTSDIIVGEVKLKKTDDAACRNQYSVIPVYSNGTNTAGDEFLRILITKFLVPTVISHLSHDIRLEKYNSILDRLKDFIFQTSDTNNAMSDSYRDILEKMVFDFWYPMALKLLEQVTVHNLQKKQQQDDEQFKIVWKISTKEGDSNLSYGFTDLENIFTYLGINIDKAERSTSAWNGEDEEELRTDLYDSDLKNIQAEDFLNSVEKVAKETFEETFASFSKTISDLKCKKVLFSGKISENTFVQKLFKEYLQKHGGEDIELISIRDYDYTGMNFKNEMKKDSKYATVIGSALYHMREDIQWFNLNITPQDTSNSFIWGIYDTSSQTYEEITENSKVSLQNVQHRISIARRCDENAIWLPSYELRVNPMQRVTFEKNNPVRFRFKSDERGICPEITGEGAFILDGERYDAALDKEKFEKACQKVFQYRIYKFNPNNNTNVSKELSWLDTGMVFDRN